LSVRLAQALLLSLWLSSHFAGYQCSTTPGSRGHGGAPPQVSSRSVSSPHVRGAIAVMHRGSLRLRGLRGGGREDGREDQLISDSDAESGDWEHEHEELDSMQKMNVEQLAIPPLYSASTGSTGEGGQEEWEVKISRPKHKEARYGSKQYPPRVHLRMSHSRTWHAIESAMLWPAA
jgi:hypothetical protein